MDPGAWGRPGYRARDSKLGREVAIKVLPGEVKEHPEKLARFEREARLLAGLNHPGIATLHGLEEAGGEPFLVMELVEGAKTTAWATTAVCILLVSACLACQSRGPNPAVAGFLGSPAGGRIRQADRAEAYRMQMVGDDMRFEIASEAVPLSPAQRSQLVEGLLEYSAYPPNNVATACAFQPAVAFRFWKDDAYTEVQACFKCSEITVLDGTEVLVAKMLFRGVMSSLLDVAKQAFPDDTDLQAIE